MEVSEEIKLYPKHMNNLFNAHTFRASCNHVTLDQLYEWMKCMTVNPTYDVSWYSVPLRTVLPRTLRGCFRERYYFE